VSTYSGNPGNVLEFEIPSGNTKAVINMDWTCETDWFKRCMMVEAGRTRESVPSGKPWWNAKRKTHSLDLMEKEN